MATEKLRSWAHSSSLLGDTYHYPRRLDVLPDACTIRTSTRNAQLERPHTSPMMTTQRTPKKFQWYPITAHPMNCFVLIVSVKH